MNDFRCIDHKGLNTRKLARSKNEERTIETIGLLNQKVKKIYNSTFLVAAQRACPVYICKNNYRRQIFCKASTKFATLLPDIFLQISSDSEHVQVKF